MEITLEADGFDGKPEIEGVKSFACQDRKVTAELTDDSELPVKLLGWIASKGARVRSMEIRSVTLAQALRRRAGGKERQS